MSNTDLVTILWGLFLDAGYGDWYEEHEQTERYLPEKLKSILRDLGDERDENEALRDEIKLLRNQCAMLRKAIEGD